MIHPYEGIEVDYVPQEQPEHIVEYRIIGSENDPHLPHLFIDGVDTWTMDAIGYPQSDIRRWQEETAKWKMRKWHGDPAMYDAIQIARLRRVKVFGEPQGVASDPPRKFEGWLMENGWRPVMLDLLNAYAPGRCLVGNCVSQAPHAFLSPSMHYTHVYVKGERSLSMQFGYGRFNFVFMLSDVQGTFQIPVDDTLFQSAVDGLLPNLDTPRNA